VRPKTAPAGACRGRPVVDAANPPTRTGELAQQLTFPICRTGRRRHPHHGRDRFTPPGFPGSAHTPHRERAPGGPPPVTTGTDRRPGRRERAPGRPWEPTLFRTSTRARRAAAAIAIVPTLTAALPPALAAAPPPGTAAAPAGTSLEDRIQLVAAVRADRAQRPAVRTYTLYPQGLPKPPAPAPAAAAAPAKPAKPSSGEYAARHRAKPSPRPKTVKRTESSPAGQAPATGSAATVIAYARAQLGKPYRYGAAGPAAFDCSGLVLAAYARIGIRLPHKAASLFGVGRSVPVSQIQPGDILILEGGGHTAIAIGGGMMIHAPHPGSTVMISKIYATPNSVRRLIG
jgi:cell wall-associated NlpC family hydrolase